MSKDKRKRKFFQGMEHLTQPSSPASPGSQVAPIAINVDSIDLLQHKYVRKDLNRVIVLVSFLLLIIIGLYFVDKKTNNIQYLAEKVTSLVIR
ncbi:MAG: hypothetical protein V1668_01250 [Patescibacteria group bacterium]